MGKKNSFLNKAFGLFVEITPDEEVIKETVEVEATKSSRTIPTKTMSLGQTNSGSSNPNPSGIPDRFRSKAITNTPTIPQATFNEEFYNHFQTVIEDNDLEGADYFEFKKTYDALKATPNMNEIVALQSTLAVLKATSPELTSEKLLETADFYIGIIQKEDDDFHAQLDEKTQTEIILRQTSIEDEVILQNRKREEILNLQAEISESEDRTSTLQEEINFETGKIEEVKSNWEFTINLVKSNIETDKTNIETYLKN